MSESRNPFDDMSIEPHRDRETEERLGARGETPLRLILTPRPEAAPRVIVPSLPAKAVAAAVPVSKPFDRVRRDSVVRMMLGTPKYAFVFVTFFEKNLIAMAEHDDLRDEERIGGFDIGSDDETFRRPKSASASFGASSVSTPPPVVQHTYTTRDHTTHTHNSRATTS